MILCCDIRFDFRIKTMFDSSSPPVICRRDYVLYTLFVFGCAQWCPTHIVLCFCFVFHRLLYPMLPVSLNCPFFIAPLAFFSVYLNPPFFIQVLVPYQKSHQSCKCVGGVSLQLLFTIFQLDFGTFFFQHYISSFLSLFFMIQKVQKTYPRSSINKCSWLKQRCIYK